MRGKVFNPYNQIQEEYGTETCPQRLDCKAIEAALVDANKEHLRDAIIRVELLTMLCEACGEPSTQENINKHYGTAQERCCELVAT